MQRVTGLGGVFLKARDPQALGEWYRRHLGLDVQPWGGVSFRRGSEDPPGHHDVTVWSLFPADSTYFDPSRAPFMVNFRVRDLASLLAILRAEGCQVDARIESSEFGEFGWVSDPEGNRIELWQPPMGEFPG